ncbi:MAG: hypothetical protein HRT74_09035 [Flavobacteriales bacterium]|nr:hypothetical protein [Flavobacteriales bacterium]
MRIKKWLLWLLAISLLVFIFRGQLFRSVFCYLDVGQRNSQLITDAQLLNLIDDESGSETMDYSACINLASEITNSQLQFSFNSQPNDPNSLFHTRKANCVGYAAFYSAVLNELFRKNNLDSKMKCEHRIGKVYCLGYNLHQLFKSPFFSDHDYVVITSYSKQVKAMDPSVEDCLLIYTVRTE